MSAARIVSAARERSPLRRRNFGLIWTSSLISDLGDWLLMIALPLYVFAITGSALGASTVFLAELIPVLVFGPILGVLVDRFDHRRTMIVLNLLQGIALLPLLAASADRLWIVYVVAAVEAALAAGFAPARQSLLPRLVPPAQLGSANSLIAVSDNLARLIGAPIGGLVLAVWGLSGVVMLDFATYLVSAALIGVSRLAAAPASEEHATERPGMFRELGAGFGTIRRTRPLGALLLIESLTAVAQGVFLVLFVVFVVRILDATDGEVGLLRGVQAIGGILGGLLVGILIRRVSAHNLIGWGFVSFGLIVLLTWNFAPISTATVFYVAFFIAMGIPAIATTAGVITVVQQVTPPGALGRVFASFGTLTQAAQGVGLFAAGLLADRFGVVQILTGQALLYILCGVLALVLLRSSARSELAGA